MDILFGHKWLIAVAVACVAFVICSGIIIHKHGAKIYFKRVLKGGTFVFALLGKFLVASIRLLAGGAKSPRGNDSTNNAARGGVYNYRTRKFDDGTDPAGLYDDD